MCSYGGNGLCTYLAQIAIPAGDNVLLLFVQVNIAVITIRRIYGDELKYQNKTPLCFQLFPIVGIFLKLGLAIYLWLQETWVITIIWVLQSTVFIPSEGKFITSEGEFLGQKTLGSDSYTQKTLID